MLVSGRVRVAPLYKQLAVCTMIRRGCQHVVRGLLWVILSILAPTNPRNSKDFFQKKTTTVRQAKQPELQVKRKVTLPETNKSHLKNGWLEDESSFWGKFGLFSGAKRLLVSGRAFSKPASLGVGTGFLGRSFCFFHLGKLHSTGNYG